MQCHALLRCHISVRLAYQTLKADWWALLAMPAQLWPTLRVAPGPTLKHRVSPEFNSTQLNSTLQQHYSVGYYQTCCSINSPCYKQIQSSIQPKITPIYFRHLIMLHLCANISRQCPKLLSNPLPPHHCLTIIPS
jgi:hypothetical protein